MDTSGDRYSTAARLTRNSAFIFLARLTDLTVAIASIALIARYLGVVDFGYFAFVTAITIFLVPFTDFGFERIITREIAGLLKGVEMDRIAGVAVGGVPLATALSLELGVPFLIVRKEKKGYGTDVEVEGSLREGEEVVLAKPRTFVNNSGEAVSYLLSRFPTPLGDLLIIYDDMDLPLGKVRIRPSGSAGGHRGMESIVSTLGSLDFPRIRVGIGRPPPGVEEIKHVLGPFTAEENTIIQEALVTVRDAVIDIMGHGLEWAMNRYN